MYRSKLFIYLHVLYHSYTKYKKTERKTGTCLFCFFLIMSFSTITAMANKYFVWLTFCDEAPNQLFGSYVIMYGRALVIRRPNADY